MLRTPDKGASTNNLEMLSRPGRAPIELSSHLRRDWPGIHAEFARLPVPVGYDFLCRPDAPRFVLLDIQRTDGETFATGVKHSAAKDLRDKLCFTPGGSTLSGWAQVAKPGSYVSVVMNAQRDGSGVPDLSSVPPLLFFDDPMLRATFAQIRRILLDPTLDLTGYMETIGILLPFEVHRLNHQRAVPRYVGGLTPRQFQHVVAYMEAHIDKSISIGELAASVELSRFHFIRAFKKTAGAPPHRYLLARRIERAKELLSTSRISVTEVAGLTGFSSIAQLTRAFRKTVGLSPSTFRREQTR